MPKPDYAALARRQRTREYEVELDGETHVFTFRRPTGGDAKEMLSDLMDAGTVGGAATAAAALKWWGALLDGDLESDLADALGQAVGMSAVVRIAMDLAGISGVGEPDDVPT